MIMMAGLLLVACSAGLKNEDAKSAEVAPEAAESVSAEALDKAADNVEGMTPAEDKRNLRPISLAFTGDIMMGTTYPENYLPENDGKDLFKDVDSILRRVDIAAGNLEGTLFDGVGVAKKCNDPSLCFAFKMPTRYAEYLSDAGYDFLGIANNHINDFGNDALRSTMQTLGDRDIAYAGLRGLCPTAIVERDGMKIGFAAFGHSTGTLSIMDFEEVKKTVSGLRDECDYVVVSFHGGGEGKSFQHVPHGPERAFGEERGDVEKFAHAAIDAGADIVYGHGPHVNRALELYNDHLILYSLGNFCTPVRMGLSGVSGYAPVAEITLNTDGTFQSGKIHSFIQQKGTGPRTDRSNAVAANIRTLTLSDFPNTRLEISPEGVISKK